MITPDALGETKLKKSCVKMKVSIITAPANHYRAVGVDEGLQHIMKNQSDCIETTSKANAFTKKQSIQSNSSQLQIFRQRTTNFFIIPSTLWYMTKYST